jgi:hypothetical protein
LTKNIDSSFYLVEQAKEWGHLACFPRSCELSQCPDMPEAQTHFLKKPVSLRPTASQGFSVKTQVLARITSARGNWFDQAIGLYTEVLGVDVFFAGICEKKAEMHLFTGRPRSAFIVVTFGASIVQVGVLKR